MAPPTVNLSPLSKSAFALSILGSFAIILLSRVELFVKCMILLSAALREDCPDDTDKCR